MKTFELIGGVGENITSLLVLDMLRQAGGEDVTFKISSLGGSTDHALVIYDLIDGYSGKTTAEILGYTASAGTIIASSCDVINMSDKALFLIHNSWTKAEGNAVELRKTASNLDKTDGLMVNLYKESNRVGKTKDEIKELMAKEDWYTADEAKELGFIDEVISVSDKIAANYKGLTNILKTKLENKMKFFKAKSEKQQSAYLLSLKDGSNVLMNAEEISNGVELAPLGEAVIEDGEIELADGRIIKVEGGVIVEVIEPNVDEMAEEESIVEAVASLISESEARIEAKMDAKIKEVKASISSAHVPVRNEKVVQEENKKTDDAAKIALSKAQAIKTEIRNRIKK